MDGVTVTSGIRYCGIHFCQLLYH